MPTQAEIIQQTIYTGYGIAADQLGETFTVYRPDIADKTNPIVDKNIVSTQAATFTNAKATGFNFQKSEGFDDTFWNTLTNGNNVRVGDYLVASSGTYFVASMQPLLPIFCVQCNHQVTHIREKSTLSDTGGFSNALPSRPGGSIPYIGRSDAADHDVTGLAHDIPCCLVTNSGRAISNKDLPTDAPGPSRWRLYVPISVFPAGSIADRDIFINEEGYRHQVSAAGWTNAGYRLESIRLQA